MSADETRERWHLDKRLPVALLVTMVAQSVAIGFWVGAIENRVTTVERWIDDNRAIEHRLTRIETLLERILETLPEPGR